MGRRWVPSAIFSVCPGQVELDEQARSVFQSAEVDPDGFFGRESGMPDVQFRSEEAQSRRPEDEMALDMIARCRSFGGHKEGLFRIQAVADTYLESREKRPQVKRVFPSQIEWSQDQPGFGQSYRRLPFDGKTFDSSGKTERMTAQASKNWMDREGEHPVPLGVNLDVAGIGDGIPAAAQLYEDVRRYKAGFVFLCVLGIDTLRLSERFRGGMIEAEQEKNQEEKMAASRPQFEKRHFFCGRPLPDRRLYRNSETVE